MVSGFLLFASLGAARDLLPERWIENLAAADGSIQQSLSFLTVAGVGYRVEISGDLVSWTIDDEIHGLGHVAAIPMRQFTAPTPVQGSGSPVPIIRPLATPSLVLRPSSEPDGGTIVSWKSLDHGGPVVHRIAIDLIPEWNRHPLFSHRCNDYYFFLFVPGRAIAPPSQPAVLGVRDSAMIQQLEANLPTMNQMVAASVAFARTVPRTAPVQPGPKKFWRIVADWSVDTDLDGSPDWAEFEVAADPSHPSYGLADAFDADVDGNQIADGVQLDNDRDGTSDDQDIALGDPSVTEAITSEARYALFAIPSSGPGPAPLSINDRGTVLYNAGVWTNGLFKGLRALPPGQGGYATSQNDLGEIVGPGSMVSAVNADAITPATVYWASPDADPAFVTIEQANGSLISAEPVSGISNDGHIICSQSFTSTPAGGQGSVEGETRAMWTLPRNGRSTTRFQVPLGFRSIFDKDTYWGIEAETEAPLWSGSFPAPPDLNSVINFVRLGNGSLRAFYGNRTPATLIGDQWITTGALEDAIDSAVDGTAIRRNPAGLLAPVLLNGRWRQITRAAAFDLPPTWRGSDVKHLDTSPGGWILTARGSEIQPEFGAMLPLRISGEYTNHEDEVITEAVGVDDFSVTASDMPVATKDRLWVMAPQERTTEVRLRAPLASPTTLEITGEGLAFNGNPTLSLANPENHFTVHATAAAATGSEILADLKLGGQVSSVSKPLGFKVMKKRTIKVAVYKITKADASGNPEVVPNLIPDEEELRNHLNEVFLPQLNANVEVRIEPTPLLVRWDVGVGNDSLDGNGFVGVLTPEQQAIEDAKNLLKAAQEAQPGHVPFAENITVYLVGGRKPISGDAFGVTSRETRTCWVIGNFVSAMTGTQLIPYDPGEGHLHTITHEIGHVLVGKGHPDQKVQPGPAPLDGTDHKRRLMCSGLAVGLSPGNLLVKGEWDAAEEWMNANIPNEQ